MCMLGCISQGGIYDKKEVKLLVKRSAGLIGRGRGETGEPTERPLLRLGSASGVIIIVQIIGAHNGSILK